MSYWLAIEDAQGGAALPVQVLSVDGVSLEIPPGSTLSELQAKLGTKVKAVRCPAAGSSGLPGTSREPVCAERVLMMPSSRVEIARRAVGRTLQPGRAAKPCLRHRP